MPASERTDRPSARRHAARSSVVWDALEPLFPEGGGLEVLDIGGGTGGFAVRVAERGHRVTVVDPSPDALAALDRRAREREVTVTGRQGELSTLLETIGPASTDVVLCHGVLEVVEDAGSAMSVLAQVLRPSGSLSLLVAQRHAAVVARAMAGHFEQARALLDSTDHGRGGRRFTHDELLGLVAGAGLRPGVVHAVRVFADLVPGSLLDLEPGGAAALVELERAVAERPEYRPLAAQLHVVATR
ncbi:class I SAM-dependent methyltransferase [Nocardioides solisilvae]|uniref:class I SAM-dependent methyltransferase n=1 Tax=Nocardioides solisilvae TaxID=1542435 RepID=UPI000D745AC2|nr:methyltransferase domain-containing protein [Nocardioides solisilvae]